MLKKNNIDEKSALELEQAKDFMRRVTPHEPSRIKRLDKKKERLDKKKDRKRPDFAFYYASGQRYILELKRWLTPEVRQLQAQLEKGIAKPLQDRLDGTFLLYIPLEKFEDGRLPPDVARQLVSEIEQRCLVSGLVEHTIQYKGASLSVRKVRDDSHRLVPVITVPELPLYLEENDKEVKALCNWLKEKLRATDEKFRCYRGKRIFLMDISQSVLDIDYHAGISKEGPGIVKKWVAALLKPSTRIDYLYLTQYRVWVSVGGSWRRMVTGHKYVDRPNPPYEEVWRKPGLPLIHSFFTV